MSDGKDDGGSQVDILSLPPADLDKIRKSMAADVEVLTSNFGTLKVRTIVLSYPSYRTHRYYAQHRH
jgi:hypothetical protein